MQSCGQNKFNPKIFVRVVCVGVPVISAIACRALAEFGVRIARLCDAGLHSHKDKRRVVHTIKRRCLELLFDGLRWKLLIRADCPEVRNDIENSLSLLSRFRGIDCTRIAFSASWSRAYLAVLLRCGAWSVRQGVGVALPICRVWNPSDDLFGADVQAACCLILLPSRLRSREEYRAQ